MQENAREIELELREEMDMSAARVRELQRDKETMQELVADHEATIHKFRGFVSQIQDQNRQLKVPTQQTCCVGKASQSTFLRMCEIHASFALLTHI